MKRFHSSLAPQLEAYLDLKRSLGFTSFAKPSLARDFDHYLVFREINSVRQIDAGLIHAWVHAIPAQARGTKNNRLKFLRGFLGYLQRVGLATENPALEIPYLEPKYRPPYIYTLKELQRLLDEARSLKTVYPARLLGWTMETLIFLLYACGLRLREALHLRIRDVDFEEEVLSLWKTKFHKERLVPFSPAVARMLKAYLARRAELYPNPSPAECFFRSGRRPSCSGRGAEWNYRRLLVRCGLAQAGGRGPRMHDLRHTFAVHRLYKWYQEGHDPLNKLPLLSTYMGHVCVASTQVYLTISRALLREGDRRFRDAFGAVADKTLERALKDL